MLARVFVNMHVARFTLWLATIVVVSIGHRSRAEPTRDWRQLANEMVDQEIVAAGVKNERVIRAMRSTPRHEFVAPNLRERAYLDMALPIGSSQTISPPFIVASMTEAIDPQPGDRVLEIGTGSGYQAAVLSPLVREVYTIEIVEELSKRATRTLKRLQRYDNVHTRAGDGYQGWQEAAPFDKIIVTCSPEKAPRPLIEQLREGGLMVIPVGERYQQTLYLMRKTDGELKSEALRATLFVPMTGTAEHQRQIQPDPANPRLTNGGFEETKQTSDGKQEPSGWHYLRQLSIVPNERAPEGSAFARFQNVEPGRGCHALQGFAVDGRKVSALQFTYWVSAKNVQSVDPASGPPRIVVTYYDERRATVAEETVGEFTGTFAWREESGRVRVPLKAREAILRLGLLGATGELCFDDVRLHLATGK